MAVAIIKGEGAVISETAAGAITDRSVWEGTDAIGVYMTSAATGEVVAIRITGEVELDKETGVAFTAGQKLYWDATNDRLDATNTNIPAGIASAAAASGATRATVILVPGGV